MFQARPLLSHAIETEEFAALADPKLGGNYVGAEMFRVIEAAAACIRHSAKKRPRMSQVHIFFKKTQIFILLSKSNFT